MRALLLAAIVGLAQPGLLPAQAPDSLLAEIGRLEQAGRWQQAIGPLERYLAVRPDDAARTRQLGQYLAWQGDRERGTELLRRAATLDPGNAEGHAVLGEVLSWQPARRAEAAEAFARALALDPANLRAREGQANLLAWSGQAREALTQFDALLAAHPAAVGALRGKGAALNQLERYEEGRTVLEQALALAPNDPGARQELATSLAGLERFDAAAAQLASALGADSPERRLLEDSVTRARGTWLEANGLGRSRSNQLDAVRGGLRLSPYLGSGARLTAEWQPTSFRDSVGRFASTLAQAEVGYRPSRAFDLSARGGLRWTDGRSGSDWSGGLGLQWRPAPTVTLSASGDRALIEETRASVLGGVFSNLGTLGLNLLLFDRRVEVFGHLVGGQYSSDSLSDNQRIGGDAFVGWVIRTWRPYLRVGYGFMGTSFDENRQATQGYFSPDRFWAHFGSLTLSNRFGERVFWEFDGRLGGQVVVQDPAGANDERLAASVNTHLTWRVARMADLDLRYQYTDAFAAFRLHEVRLLFRQYF